MPQADSEDRLLSDELANGFNRIGQPLRVSWAIGQENPVRQMGKDGFRRGGSGENRYLTVPITKRAKDIIFDAVVQGDHPKPSWGGSGWKIGIGERRIITGR